MRKNEQRRSLRIKDDSRETAGGGGGASGSLSNGAPCTWHILGQPAPGLLQCG